MLIPLKFGKSQFLANLVIANAQLLNLLVRHMHLPTGFKIDTIDDTVGMNVFTVGMRTDQHLTALKVSSKLSCCFVCCARVDVCTF